MLKKAGVILFFIALIGILGVLFYMRGLYSKIVVKPSSIINAITRTSPTPTPDPYAPFNVLLLGYGGAGHDGGSLTDTIILANIQPKNETVTLISIPRDTWIGLPLGGDTDTFYKINAAYAFGIDQTKFKNRPDEFKGEAGGGQLAKYAVKQATGINPEYFIALDFNGFTQGINTLGGVSVTVPHTFDDYYYPIENEKKNDCGKTPEEVQILTATLSGELLEQQFPCRYEQLHFDKGIQTMNGETALKFVRSRKSAQFGGDFNRSLRQLALLQAVKEKVISLNFIPKAFPFASTIANHVRTDIDAGVVADKLNLVTDPGNYSLYTISLDTDNVLEASRSADGQFVLVPKLGSWETVYEYINNQLNPISAPSPVVDK